MLGQPGANLRGIRNEEAGNIDGNWRHGCGHFATSEGHVTALSDWKVMCSKASNDQFDCF
ncbi:Unknown protein sequence [Pseudomonas syringae pv. maculicola]|nr:Unknown protein sequence [Pseudomonas syringae pv. maculicola]